MKKPSYVCRPAFALKKLRRGRTLNKWELEKISKSPSHAVRYAVMLGTPWPEGEPYIAQDPGASVAYALQVIKGRWEPGEKKISERGDWSVDYSKKVVKGRFEEGEDAILEDMDNAAQYCVEVLKGRWDRFENNLLSGKYDKNRNFLSRLCEYFEFVPGRWEEWEGRLLKKNRASWMYNYSRHIYGKLPEALHQKMMMYSFDPKKMKWSKKYLQFLDRCTTMAMKVLESMSDEEFQKIVRMRNG